MTYLNSKTEKTQSPQQMQKRPMTTSIILHDKSHGMQGAQARDAGSTAHCDKGPICVKGGLGVVILGARTSWECQYLSFKKWFCI